MFEIVNGEFFYRASNQLVLESVLFTKGFVLASKRTGLACSG
jgi:hypothetical protein